MKAGKTSDTLEILINAYAGDGTTSAKLYHLRNEQLDLIERLAKRYGESQVSVLRSIIDEWRNMKIKQISKATPAASPTEG